MQNELHQVQIIIAVYGKSKFLDRCRESIIQTVKHIPYSIRVIDTANPRISLAAAWNIGAKESHFDTLCFLNDDTLQSDGWLDKLVHVLYSSDTFGAVSPSTSACANNKQKLYFEQMREKNVLSYNQHDVDELAKKVYSLYQGQIEIMDMDMSSCCLVMRKSTWEKVTWVHPIDKKIHSGFYELYFPAYGEDNDFLDEMEYKHKLHPVWVKDVYVHHFRRQTADRISDINRAVTDKIFWKRFEERHGMSYKEWRRSHPKK